jgi:hypothetical protein
LEADVPDMIEMRTEALAGKGAAIVIVKMTARSAIFR